MTKLTRNRELDKANYPDCGYYWVPAAVNNASINLVVGVKEVGKEQGSKFSIERKEIKGRAYYFSSAGYTRQIITTSSPKRFAKQVDSIVYLGKQFLKEAPFMLYGAADASVTQRSAHRDPIRAQSYVLQDSGGFQLATGVVDFMDPVHVAKAHSIYADSGVALEIPASGLDNKELVVASAKMLVANNAVMRDKTDKAVRLINVCHGKTLDIRLAYLKTILKGEKLDALCIGGLRNPLSVSNISADRSSPLGFTAHVLMSMMYTEKIYSHYHVLGVSAEWQMALLAVISAMHQKLVTSDSATPKLAAKSGLLLMYGTHKKATYGMGKDITEYCNTRCGCLVCSTVQYEFILRGGSFGLSYLHNGFVMLKKAAMYDSLAKQHVGKMSCEALTALLLKNTSLAFAPHPMQNMFRAAMKIIHTTKDYESLLHLKHTAAERKTLFSSVKAVSSEGEKKVAAVIKRYEKYHGKSFL